MLTLYLHPLASYCWKVLVALYEADVAFHPRIVDLSSEADRAELTRLWPIGKLPVLRDDERDRVVGESTTILAYLARFHPGRAALIPSDPELADEARALDRFYDLHVHEPMQSIVFERLRPPSSRDPQVTERAQERLAVAYRMIEDWMQRRTWAAGEGFTIADCAAAPALYYANEVRALGAEHPHTTAYLARLQARPSFARVLAEAAPYAHMFPR